MRHKLVSKNNVTNECGNVTLEFIGVVVGLLLPILGLVFASVAVAKSYVLQENAVRLGSRVITVSASHSINQARQEVKTFLREQGISDDGLVVSVTCSSRMCNEPTDLVRVSAHRNYVVRILGLPVRTIRISAQQVVERGIG